MQLDSDDLLQRIQQEYPVEFELARRGLLIEAQAAEIDRLRAQVQQAQTARPYAGFGNEEQGGARG